jgi:hypothetical protein
MIHMEDYKRKTILSGYFLIELYCRKNKHNSLIFD